MSNFTDQEKKIIERIAQRLEEIYFSSKPWTAREKILEFTSKLRESIKDEEVKE